MSSEDDRFQRIHSQSSTYMSTPRELIDRPDVPKADNIKSKQATSMASSAKSETVVKCVEHQDTATSWEVPLALIPSTLEITSLFIPQAVADPPIIVHNEKILDNTVLMCLALNEETRKLRRGFFYYLPLRESTRFGHPCDVVFMPSIWTAQQAQSWDSAGWERRSVFCSAIQMGGDREVAPVFDLEESKSSTRVVPICARILQSSPGRTGSSNRGTGLARYATTSDPAMCPGELKYSRTLDDQSTWIIILNTDIERPISCRLEALEEAALECVKELHPSMAYHSSKLRLDPQSAKGIWSTPAELNHDESAGGLDDVPRSLLKAVDDDNKMSLHHPKEWGDLQRTWREIQSVLMDNQRHYWERAA